MVYVNGFYLVGSKINDLAFFFFFFFFFVLNSFCDLGAR